MHSDDHNRITLALPDAAATTALGARLAPLLDRGWVVFLEGDLGAGKTSLVRSILRTRGCSETVRSPTYTLVEVHVISGLDFYHFDFYRVSQAEEFLDAGLDEYFEGNGICLVEWPDHVAPYLPAPDLRVRLAFLGEGREVLLGAETERGRACLGALNPART